MPSIGPQLPPHLQKRKRTPESHASRDSPPSKVTRRANDDEIALDDGSSDDDFGPSTGPAAGPAMPASAAVKSAAVSVTARPRPPIGPSMPQAPNNEDEIALSDEEDGDAMGPTRPPAPASRSPAPKRIIGPAPPPNDLSERPTTDPNPDSDSDSGSDSDSDYGPALPTAGSSRRTAPTAPPPSTKSTAPKRDDWMLAPAAASSRAVAPDPTKLRARKFASGRAAAASESHAGGISSIWTETPEEKRQRLADAVLGRGGEGEGSSSSRRKDKKKDGGGGKGAVAADEDRIRSYTEQTRGKSLYEEHQVRRKVAKEGGGGGGEGAEVEEEDDPSKRAFNWEKDMKAGSTISHSQRRQLLTKSANFGGRFEKGSYL